MLLQKNYNKGQDAPIWEDYNTHHDRPDQVVEALRIAGAVGEYRILYVSHGQIAEQRFVIERHDAFKVRHKATRRKAVDASKSGPDAVADSDAEQPNPPGQPQ